MGNSPSIREIVEFGLDAVPEDRQVAVSLRDLLLVHQVLGELNRFFHQPMHYSDLKAVREFLDSQGSGGAYEVLADAYYNKLGHMLPADVNEQHGEGALEHPERPSYYKHGA